MQRRELCLLLCDNPDAWDGGRRKAQEGGDTCMHIADSHCTAETNTALLGNYEGQVLGA